MKQQILSLILLLSGSAIVAQSTFKDQLPEKPIYTEAIVDDQYGITIYEPLNMVLSGDSVRLINGYVAQNWVEDYYENGQLLHKGYYIDGQLKVYKNYYPDGTLERSFINIDNFRSKVTLYYPSGSIKSEVKYTEAAALIWTDYYSNGNVEYYEEYHKDLLYYVAKRSYYEDGKAESLFEMTDKKKLYYSQNDFYNNGNKKLEGNLRYDKGAYDYFRIGKWLYFNETGKPLKTEEYTDGMVTKTNTH